MNLQSDQLPRSSRSELTLEDLPRELLDLDEGPQTPSGRSKRILDVAFASMALVAALPLLLLIALGVAVTSPGPVLFRQRRLGVNGRHFWCYKFRSMVHDAESVLDHDPKLKSLFSENFKLRHDPRVTRFGAFLRESSLDELPQFFNVLKGDMTLIGPRPIVPDELAKYGSFDTKLLTVTPGLTGLWQILGRSDTSYAERVALDMLYIDHQSLALDLKIMWMTWGAVLRRKGAC